MASKTGRDEALILAFPRGLTARAAAKASGYRERQSHRKLGQVAKNACRRWLAAIRSSLFLMLIGTYDPSHY